MEPVKILIAHLTDIVRASIVLFKNPVTVRTDPDVRRVTIICGVAYDEDLDAARQVIADAVAACSTVRQGDLPIQVFAQEFADSSINFEVTWWTGATPVEVRKSKDEVVSGVKRGLDDAGIEIPFPYRTLTFKEPLKLRHGSDDTGRDETPES